MRLEDLEAAWNAQADGYNQWTELGLDEILSFAQDVEREECARICDDIAEKLEEGAQRSIENCEPEEAHSIRSAAWRLGVAASRIRARTNETRR